MARERFVFWILTTKKRLSFHFLPGYEIEQSDTKEEMWEKIHSYVDSGYKVE